MINHLLNSLKAQAALASNNIAHNDVGIITAYDPNTRLVRVQTSEADDEDEAGGTGWIPVLSQQVGAGWGFFTAPSPGDLCFIAYHQGSRQAPVGVLGMFFSPPNNPVPTQSGEIFLIHKNGMSLKLTNDGKALFGKESAAINLENGKVTLTADMEINILAPTITIGDLSGDLLPLKKADDSNTANVKAS